MGVGEWGVAACIDPPVAGHIMPYPAKAPPPPLSSRIASRTPPAVTQRLAGVGFHRRVFDCTPSTHDANRDLVWLRRQALDGGAGGGMCETGRGKPLFRGQKVTPANLIFWYLYFFTTSRHLFIYLFIYFLLLQRHERRHRSQPDVGTCTVFFWWHPKRKGESGARPGLARVEVHLLASGQASR